MPIYVKGKIPWSLIIIVLLVVAFAIFALTQWVPSVGVSIMGGLAAISAGLYSFFIGAPTYLSVFTAVAITAGVVIIVAYRKYFFKQKISNSSAMAPTMAPTLQGGLINTQPLQQIPIPQQIIGDGKTEVTTT